MIRLFTSQINRSLCRLMGLDKLQLQEFEGRQAELTCEWDLELMERYDDFKYVTENMFRKALTGDDLHDLTYEVPKQPNAKAFPTVDCPLNCANKVSLDQPMEIFFEVEDRPINYYKTAALMPEMSRLISEYQAQERKKNSEKVALERKQKQAEKAERKAAAKAAKMQKPAPLSKEEQRKAEESAKAVAKAYEKLGLNPDGSAIVPQDDNEAQSATLDGVNSSSEVASDADKEQDSQAVQTRTPHQIMMDSVCESLYKQHRYQNRKLYIRTLPSRNGDMRSIEWGLDSLHQHLIVPQDGLTDLMADIIAYQYFANLPASERAQFPYDLSSEILFKSLLLSDVVIFHDGKMMFWYEVKGNVCGSEIQGFGIDIDPPFKRNFAVSIKHIYYGKLADHPTVAKYRQMLSHDKLFSVAQDVHYCQNDNLSPFSEDETTEQMSFINDAFMILDLEVPSSHSSIEVLVKDSLSHDLDAVADRIKDLKDNDLSDFDALNADIVDLIAEPIVEMKNEQEERRRNKDEEFASYIFKDNIHRQEFTIDKLKRGYPLKIERIVLNSEEEIKFLINTNLFAYIEKQALNDNQSNMLGMVHADCIMVTFLQGDNGLELSGIDLTDSIQIPYGKHKNEDITSFSSSLMSLLENKNAPIPEDWDKEWLEAIEERRQKDQELNDKAMATRKHWNEFAQATRTKTIQTRARLRKERKKKR